MTEHFLFSSKLQLLLWIEMMREADVLVLSVHAVDCGGPKC